MDDNFLTYAIAIVVLVAGLFIVKKVTTCMIKATVAIVMVVFLVALYWLFLT